MNEQQLAALVEERRRSIMRDARLARRFHLRRRVAAAFRALAARLDEPADVPAEEAGTVPA